MCLVLWLTEDGLWGHGQAHAGCWETCLWLLLTEQGPREQTRPFLQASLHASEKWSLRDSSSSWVRREEGWRENGCLQRPHCGEHLGHTRPVFLQRSGLTLVAFGFKPCSSKGAGGDSGPGAGAVGSGSPPASVRASLL